MQFGAARIAFAILAFVLSGYATAYAQLTEVHHSRNYLMAPKDKFSIIGKVAGRTAVCLIYEEDSEIVLYDSKMNEDTIIDLPYLNSKHYNYKFIKAGDRLTLIFEQKKGDALETYYVQYDKSFKIVGTPLLLNARKVNKDSEFTGYAVSDQKKVFAIYYNVVDKEKDEVVFHYTTFKITGERLHSNTISYNITTTKPDITVLVRDNAEINMLMSLYDDTEKEISGLLYGYGTTKIESLAEVPLGDNTYHRVQYSLSEQLQNLTILLQSKTFYKKKVSNLYKVVVDLNTHQQASPRKIPLKEDVTETSSSHEGFDNYVPQKTMPIQNGGLLYLTEFYDYEESGSQNFFRRDFGVVDQTNTITEFIQKKYTHGDILCLLLSAKDSIVWQNRIHKLQVSTNDEGVRSSFCTMVSRDNIKVLFMANPMDADLQLVTITPNGELKYSLLNNVANVAGTLICQKSVQVGENEIIMPCVSNTQLSFTRLAFPPGFK
jgi:hypothetical protein